MTGRLRLVLLIAAIVLAAFATLAALVSGFSAPGWVLPVSALVGFVAVLL